MRMRVASTRGGVLPADGNLVEVECHNLSCSGCAYWTMTTPEHKELLVVFGENEIRLKARVVHCEVKEHDGRLRTLVGCQFVKRL
jgi:hypothetical protein